MLGRRAKRWDGLLCASCQLGKLVSSEQNERGAMFRFESWPRGSECQYGQPTDSARVAAHKNCWVPMANLRQQSQ